LRQRQDVTVPRAKVKAEQMQTLHEMLKKELEFVRTRMKAYYDRHRLEGPRLERGDKVYLNSRNLRTKRPSKKLDFKKIGPFKIEERISTSNYRQQFAHERPVPVNVRVDIVRDWRPDAGDGVPADGRPAVAFHERGDGRHRDGVVGQRGSEWRVAGFVAEAAQVGSDVVRGFGPSQDGKRPVCVGGDDELLEQGDVVAFVLDRTGTRQCRGSVGWSGEACNFEGHRVTDADGDLNTSPAMPWPR
jgi:hypothetical protein